MSDILILTETWLEENEDVSKYDMTDYTTNLNSQGRGRGIASYYKKNFNHIMNINCEGFSMSKIGSKNIDVIGIYRSQGANDKDLIEKLKMLFDKEKTTIIGGDLNICVRAHSEIT